MWPRLAKWLVALALSATLVAPLPAQNDPAQPPPTQDQAAPPPPERRPPAPEYMVAFIAAMGILLVVCMPSRKG